MIPPVKLFKHGAIAVISIDNPPVNALSQTVRRGIANCLRDAEIDEDVSAIVLACQGRTFIAGADISEFGKPPLEPHLPEVLQNLDQCKKPVVAALFGTALGGGFELALSCHYRVGITGTKVGLPEVTLGLIPGAGGTQLLPRIAGVETALEMITSGKLVTVDRLLELKIIDQLVEGDLLENAISYAKSMVDKGQGARPVSQIVIDKSANHAALFDEWRAKMARTARGQIAPQHCITSIENAVRLPFPEGLKKEREMFLECRSSSQSRAMRHAFFAERQSSKPTGINNDVAALAIHSVGVIGAGTMGGGIAMCFSSAGIPVTILEMGEGNLQRGLDGIRSRYQKNVTSGRISQQQCDSFVGNIQGTCDYKDLANVDLVVEAAFEDMAIKHQIFARLDEACKPETILATNTSYLDVDEIARATNRPNKVLGMHFFSPANIMKLLEVVRAEKTDEQTLITGMAIGKLIGKTTVSVGVCYGFVGNRMYSCYGREAQMLLLEGATPEQIDHAMKIWGMAMGPLAVNDLSGIDIAYKARRENPNLPDDPCYFKAADLMVESGRLGQKTGAGFYRYEQESGNKVVDQDVLNIIRTEAEKLGIRQRVGLNGEGISDEEIQNRLILALINEGARILEEGIVTRASDIDVIWINGYGFPRFRGGPMCYADEVGLQNVVHRINQFRQQFGDRYWRPAALLEEMASQGRALASWSK